MFLISCVLGICSHLFWDDFTKPDGVVYYLAPSFFAQEIQAGPIQAPLYLLIERTGSVLGLLFIIWVICRKKKPASPVSQYSISRKLSYWSGIFVATAIIAAIRLLISHEGDTIGFYVVVLTSASVLAFVFVTTMAFLLNRADQKAAEY